jgi:hypothetical protein
MTVRGSHACLGVRVPDPDKSFFGLICFFGLFLYFSLLSANLSSSARADGKVWPVTKLSVSDAHCGPTDPVTYSFFTLFLLYGRHA